MAEGLLIEEEYFDSYYRVIKIDDGDSRLYSIDYYKLLPRRPENCDKRLSLSGTEICYIRVGEYCTAVILVTESRVELVNLRLKTASNLDPARGSLARARDICVREVNSVAWNG